MLGLTCTKAYHGRKHKAGGTKGNDAGGTITRQGHLEREDT